MGVSCRISEEERRKRLKRIKELMVEGSGPFQEQAKKNEMLAKRVIKKL